MGDDGTTTTSKLSNFELQVRVWGYAVDGTGDKTTRIVERDWKPTVPMWDDTEVLRTAKLNGAVPPEFFALPWVCEYVRRKKMEREVLPVTW